MENIKDKIIDFYSNSEPVYYAINAHLAEIINWANSTNTLFSIKTGALGILDNTLSLYVNLNDNIQDENYLIKTPGNYFILGAPGSGKSILIKRLIVKMLLNERREYGTPILIRAKELQDGSIYQELKNIFDTPQLEFAEIIRNIDKNNFTILIDGIDELSPGAFGKFIDEATYVYENIKKAKIISTSRFQINFPNCTNCEIQPLTEKQLEKFIHLGLTAEQSDKFLIQANKLRLNPNPLTIGTLLSIFQHEGELPRDHISVYTEVVNLFLKDWDIMRAVVRKALKDFSPYRKKEVLSFLAFDLLANFMTTSYSKKDLLESLIKIVPKFNLRESDSEMILFELVNYTGLITEIAYNRYEFSHKSIQEYLAANYLIKLPGFSFQSVLERMPNVLSFCVLISSDPHYYLAAILDTIEIEDTEQTEKNLIFFLTTLFQMGEKKQFIGFDNYSGNDSGLKERSRLIEHALQMAYNKSSVNGETDQ